MPQLPRSVFQIKMGYWCDVRGIYDENLRLKAEWIVHVLDGLPCVNSAEWNKMHSPVFEIDLNINEVQRFEDLIYFDKRFRKIIADGGMKIED